MHTTINVCKMSLHDVCYDPPRLRVVLDHKDARLPAYGSPGAAGLDLCSVEEVVVVKCASVNTGLRVAIPRNRYGRVAARSGNSFNHHIEVGAGVIDSDYRGVIRVKLYNHGDTPFLVEPGMKIAQLIIEKIDRPVVAKVADLDVTERGDAGFGSTGDF